MGDCSTRGTVRCGGSVRTGTHQLRSFELCGCLRQLTIHECLPLHHEGDGPPAPKRISDGARHISSIIVIALLCTDCGILSSTSGAWRAAAHRIRYYGAMPADADIHRVEDYLKRIGSPPVDLTNQTSDELRRKFPEAFAGEAAPVAAAPAPTRMLQMDWSNTGADPRRPMTQEDLAAHVPRRVRRPGYPFLDSKDLLADLLATTGSIARTGLSDQRTGATRRLSVRARCGEPRLRASPPP